METSNVKCLPLNTARLLSSGQVVTSASSCVKELLENSLDAGAQSISIKILNFGLDTIEVMDDGCGVSYDNVQKMFQPGFTSKISEFSHLDSLTTYGFRGVALGAICRVAEVTVTTKTEKDELAMTYVISPQGVPVSSTPASLKKGTLITIKNLFKALPVRKQYSASKKAMKDDLKKLEYFVQCLAVINPSVRVVLMHNKGVIWQKNGVDNLKKSFMQLIGLKTISKLEFLEQVSGSVKVVCAVLKKETKDFDGVLGTTPNSFCFVNKRPVVYKEIMKLIDEAMKVHFYTDKRSISFVSITVDPSYVDVNIEPDKTKVLLNNIDQVLDILRTLIQNYYGCLLEKPVSPHEETIHEEELDDVPAKRTKYDEFLNGDDFNRNEKYFEPTPVVLHSLSSRINMSNSIATPSEIHNLNERLQGKTQAISIRNVTPSNDVQQNLSLASEKDIQEINKLIDDKIPDTIPTQELFERLISSNQRPELTIANWSRGCAENQVKKVQPGVEVMTKPGLMNSGAVSFNDTKVQTSRADKVQNVTKTPIKSAGNLILNQILPPATACDFLNNDQLQEIEEFRTPVVTRPCVVHSDGQSGPTFTPQGEIPKEHGSVTNFTKQQSFQQSVLQTSVVHRPFDGQAQSNRPHEEMQHNPGISETISTICKTRFLFDGQDQNVKEIQPIPMETSTPSTVEASHSILNNGTPDVLGNSGHCPYNSTTIVDDSRTHQELPSHMEDDLVMFNSSRESVCSQLNRKDLSGFTKYASLERPKIVQQNPSILFTTVTKLLTDGWRQLTADEREYYANLAKEVDKKKKIHREEKLSKKEVQAEGCRVRLHRQAIIQKPKEIERKQVPLAISRQCITRLRSMEERNKNSDILIGQIGEHYLSLIGDEIGIFRLLCLVNENENLELMQWQEKEKLFRERFVPSSLLCRHHRPLFTAIYTVQPPAIPTQFTQTGEG